MKRLIVIMLCLSGCAHPGLRKTAEQNIYDNGPSGQVISTFGEPNDIKDSVIPGSKVWIYRTSREECLFTITKDTVTTYRCGGNPDGRTLYVPYTTSNFFPTPPPTTYIFKSTY